MTLDEVNSLAPDAFVDSFGQIAERCPWVATKAGSARPYGSRDHMVERFQAAIASAARADQEALILAHPDLAGRAALAGTVAEASIGEQSGAGLDHLSRTELDRFEALNARYRARFGFPFILAVKGATRHQIIEAFEQRLEGGREEEFHAALSQVMRIVRFRIEDRVDE